MKRIFLLTVATALGSAIAMPSFAQDEAVKRGEYLVATSGCHDCHTPLTMGANGPEPDMSRALSGHPAEITVDAAVKLQDPWMSAASTTNTAWAGPWGVSFTANLTPDPETGVFRDMTEQQFVETIRSGRHLGLGRPILPPMPWPAYRNMTDEDLVAVYAYLQTVKPIRNQVPEPLPPSE